MIASLVESCTLKHIDPQAYLSNTLSRLAAGHSPSAIDHLMRLFLSSHSPDFNSIEMTKVKAHLQKIDRADIHGLGNAIARVVHLYSPKECFNCYAADSDNSD